MSSDDLKSDLELMISDNPTEFTFDGVTFDGQFSALARTETVDEGGFVQEYDYSLTAIVSDFTDAGKSVPAIGQKITASGVDYRIAKKATDHHGVGVTFDLMTVNK